MTTVVLRPDATVTDGGATLVGGATVHAVTLDDSDATYAVVAGAGAVEVGFGTVAVPATALVKQVRARMRVRSASGTVTSLVSLRVDGAELVYVTNNETTTIVERATGWAAQSLTQAQVDALQVYAGGAGGPGDRWIVALYIDLMYAAIPVAAITYPTGSPTVTTTNVPTVTWTHTAGSDGGPQTYFQVKVFTAAQVAIGGFDPSTSPNTFDSGEVVGAATSIAAGPFVNGVVHVYVRTAQTINGEKHWSAWVTQSMTISVATPVVTVAAVPDNATGSTTVTLTRSVTAWNYVEVQRSDDAGATWVYVRGAAYVIPPLADTFVVVDREASNGATVRYRGRAARIVSGLSLVGVWAESTPAVAWSSADWWLKAPNDSTLNVTVTIAGLPQLTRTRRQGVHYVLGRATPVVVSDVRSAPSGTLTLRTDTDAELVALETILAAEPVLLLQGPPDQWFGSRYVALGDVDEYRFGVGTDPGRFWTTPFVVVDSPADPTSGL